jgi:hypothetical protein
MISNFIVITFLLIFGELLLFKPIETNTIHIVSTQNSDKDDNKDLSLKRHVDIENINICPSEYDICFCDYTNTNLVNMNQNDMSISFSILVDCQYHVNSDSSQLNNTPNEKGQEYNNFKAGNRGQKQMLMTIPEIGKSGTKFKYLKNIVHLDLSNTGITEIPTDAFKVTLLINLLFFFFI